MQRTPLEVDLILEMEPRTMAASKGKRGGSGEGDGGQHSRESAHCASWDMKD